MRNAGQVERIDPSYAHAGVMMFPALELAKQRRRAIKHTKLINDFFGKDTVPKVTLPSRLDQSSQATKGKWSFQCDFAAYFDQFELAVEIRPLMCFVSNGEAYALTRMPMGQRHSVGIAQGATNILLSFLLPRGVTAQSCIDNVRFVGPRAGVIRAASELIRRCRIVGVSINDLPATNSPQQDCQSVERMVHQQGTWLGAEYDYIHSRQRVADKSIQKLDVSWNNRHSWTSKHYAAHMGLLFFAASVTRHNPGLHFEVMKRYRIRSANLTSDPSAWNTRVDMSSGEMAAMQSWTSAALANAWVPCDHTGPATKLIATDASEWGWGAIFCDLLRGSVLTCSEAWSTLDRQKFSVSDSVYEPEAEPEAVYRALCRFIRPTEQDECRCYH